MILRFSQKLGARLKAGPLSPAPLGEAPVADWTSHIFFFDRAPYILVSNTAALYSVVLYAKGITNESMFITSFMTSLRDIMAADGLAAAYDRFITPHAGTIRLASAYSRSVTGSMTELIKCAKFFLSDDDLSPFELGFQLNDLLLSPLASEKSRGYGKPREAFQTLIAESPRPLGRGG